MLRKQLLITSLSDSDYTETEYSMGGNVHRSKFPPVALATMLQLRGWHALVFASKGAGHEHYADLQKEFECAGLTAEFIEISVARSQSDHMSILDLMTDQICDNSEVILDITYSQGHLPFIYLAALSYLVGLRAVQLSGIYHGVTVGAGLAELIEITALFELTQWYHAIATAKQSGDHRPLVTLMEKQRRELFRHKIESAEVSNTVSSMKSLSEALASGLPVEIGIYSARVSQALMNMEKSTVPTSITLKFARERFRKVVDQWAIANDLHKMQKKDVRLDWNELSRQLHLTEWFLQKQQQPTVAMLLREWFVSLVLHLRAESADDWLTHGTRASAEKLLNSLETACRKIY